MRQLVAVSTGQMAPPMVGEQEHGNELLTHDSRLQGSIAPTAKSPLLLLCAHGLGLHDRPVASDPRREGAERVDQRQANAYAGQDAGYWKLCQPLDHGRAQRQANGMAGLMRICPFWGFFTV